jgi:hypothetical protein
MAGIDYAVPIVAAVLGAYPIIREAKKEKGRKSKDFIAWMTIGTAVLVAVSITSIWYHNQETEDARKDQLASDSKISNMGSELTRLHRYIRLSDSTRNLKDSAWRVNLLAERMEIRLD